MRCARYERKNDYDEIDVNNVVFIRHRRIRFVRETEAVVVGQNQ